MIVVIGPAETVRCGLQGLQDVALFAYSKEPVQTTGLLPSRSKLLGILSQGLVAVLGQ